MTLRLYSGDRTLRLDLSPPANPTEIKERVAEARQKVAQFSPEPLSTDQLDAFEANLRRWLQGSPNKGVMSLDRALDDPTGSEPPKRTPVSVRFDAAHEVELRGRQIERPGLRYGSKVSQTGTNVEGWDLFALTADQVKGQQGCIEVVFGKHDVTDGAEFDRRATVLRLLQDALSAHAGGPLSEAVDAFNLALQTAAIDDSELARYRLNTTSSSTTTRIEGPTYFSTQTNVEVDLRKIGDINDTTIPGLFTGPNHATDRAMFIEARKQASNIVDDVFRRTAAQVHGGRYRSASIKLDKLRATMTLLLYSTAKVKVQGSKGAWPVLPKVGAGDLIRETLNARDKLTLFHHTSDDTRYAALETRLLDALATIKGVRDYDKQIGEQDNLRFGSGKISERGLMRYELENLLRPGRKRTRYGRERRGYGRVNWSDRSYAGTVTGKPIRTTYNQMRRNLTRPMAKVVLEVRRGDNPINSAVEAMVDGASRLAEGGAFAALQAAASAPTAERAPKVERR